MTPQWTPARARVLLEMRDAPGNRELVARLGLSMAAVKWHLSQTMRRLRVGNRYQVALYARDHAELLKEITE